VETFALGGIFGLLDNSRIRQQRQLADWTTRVLDISRTGQLADQTTRVLDNSQSRGCRRQ